MLGKIITYEYSMKVCAWDIVRLNIRAHVVAKITEYIGGGTNGAYTSNPTSRALYTPSNMWS
jgi:hypothetical protein